MNLVSQHDLQMIAIWEASNSLSLLEDSLSKSGWVRFGLKN